VKVLGGTIKPGYRLMNANGTVVGEIREIQHEKKNVEKATIGMELAISCDGITLGKDCCEEDILYTYIIPDELKEWEKHLDALPSDDKMLLEKIKRMILKNPW
jgi:translation initiation factor 5B